MRTYVIRRLLLFIPTLFIVSMLVFLSVRLLPGDFVDLLLSDPMSRNIYGARLSLLVGFAATTVAVLVATVVGGLSGFVGGRLDLLTQRFVDAWMAFPCEPGGSGTVAVVGEGDVARTGAGFLIVGCVTKCRGPLPGGGVCVGGKGVQEVQLRHRDPVPALGSIVTYHRPHVSKNPEHRTVPWRDKHVKSPIRWHSAASAARRRDRSSRITVPMRTQSATRAARSQALIHSRQRRRSETPSSGVDPATGSATLAAATNRSRYRFCSSM